MTTRTLTRPGAEHPERIYHNSYHVLNEDVATELRNRPNLYAIHSALQFTGYVWFDPVTARWYEEIYRYHAHLITLEARDVEALIRRANHDYGQS